MLYLFCISTITYKKTKLINKPIYTERIRLFTRKKDLSTKDIAQFTNLTIRGVETARYRIRKKLAIPGNINLVDFLINFT
ncbi:hypothetical protein DXA46_03050 [Bacteroides sp. OF02-3LB]|nr:hypothetical protein DWY71_01290 [Bacteroides sp. AF26-7BH]RGY35877.1 hypothetical protein DXA46_03050 [Bacteroides sp. OF02-3LB]